MFRDFGAIAAWDAGTRKTSMRGIGLISTVIFFVLMAPSAHAASKEGKERAARKACLGGDYAKGIEILSDLFIDTQDPTFLFNQGRCFEQNSRYQEAIGRFREYLRKASGLSPKDRAEAETHIADCQALLAGKDAAPSDRHPETDPAAFATEPPSPSVATPPAAAPLPLPPAPAVEPAAQVNAPASEASNRGRGLRIAGIASGAVGLASIGTAVYFYTQARSLSDKYSKSRNPKDEQAGKNAETMQWVCYSVGVAAIGTGVLLYWLGRPSSEGNSTVTGVAPLIGPGLAGISAQGAF